MAFGLASQAQAKNAFDFTGPVTEHYKPSNGQVHYADAPSTSFSNGDKSSRQYSISKQTVLRRLREA